MKIISQPISVFFFYLQWCKSTMHFSQLSFSIINLKINILNCQSQGICQICFTYQGRRPRPTESELLYGNLNQLSSSKPSILTATKMTSAITSKPAAAAIMRAVHLVGANKRSTRPPLDSKLLVKLLLATCRFYMQMVKKTWRWWRNKP